MKDPFPQDVQIWQREKESSRHVPSNFNSFVNVIESISRLNVELRRGEVRVAGVAQAEPPDANLITGRDDVC